MKYEVKFTSQFKKDLKKAKKQGKDLSKLFEVVDILARGDALDPKYKDHRLIGNYKDARECHLEPDWLLVYRLIEPILILSLTRTGSHSEIF